MLRGKVSLLAFKDPLSQECRGKGPKQLPGRSGCDWVANPVALWAASLGYYSVCRKLQGEPGETFCLGHYPKATEGPLLCRRVLLDELKVGGGVHGLSLNSL